MILSSTSLSAVTAAPSIIEDIDGLLGTDSTSYPLASKLRNINLAYYDVVSDILSAQSNWEWDDTNKTDFPIGTTTLVNGQRDYSLPTDIVKLLRVEILNSSGDYVKLQQFDETQTDVALTELSPVDGIPQYYREIGNSIELYPSPATGSVTMALGLKVYYQRTITEFTNADASLTPGFAAPYHRILSLSAAYDYAFSKTLPIAGPLLQKMNDMKTALKESYASRNREVRPSIGFRSSNYE